jgi:acyl-CoA thioesterase FadM
MMPYFALPYQILFHDTMAYGSQHHTVNIKLQNVARETILFASRVDGREVWQEQLKDIVMLTREVYSLNLAQVDLGQKVAVLMTYEDPTHSTVRLCFRIVRFDGQPVACGYQTMILMDRETQGLVGPPPMLAQYLDAGRDNSLVERLAEPSFGERVKGGGRWLKDIFPPEIRALGAHVANAERARATPRIVDESFREFDF